ncbi:NUMOD4 domain-containing protein [Pseudomonas sp. MT3]
MADAIVTSEQWRTVSGFEELYEVSSLGRVRSLPRTVAFGKTERQCGGIVLRQGRKPSGYMFVMLCREGGQECANVHRLVAKAFVEGWFDGAQVNHKDGNKANNASINLEWCTAGQNILHSYQEGLRARGATDHLIRFGEQNSQAKLSAAQVAEIRELSAQGISGAEVARRFGVSASQVCRIKKGLRWPQQVA